MAEQENKEKPEPAQADSSELNDDRYRYIGFDVFPKQAKEFWKSDNERKTYLEHVRETAGRFMPLSRANSFVATSVLSTFEKVVLGLASLMLVAAPFITWFSVSRGQEHFTYSGMAVATHAGSIMKYLSMGAGKLETTFILMLAMMFLSMLFGLATLAMLFLPGSNPEQHVGRLRRILALQYIPIIGWVVFLVMAGVPTELPFVGSLGLMQVNGTLNLGSLAASSSVGLWIPFAALWVNAIKSNDL